jgi:hypothetical protein
MEVKGKGYEAKCMEELSISGAHMLDAAGMLSVQGTAQIQSKQSHYRCHVWLSKCQR